MPQPTRPWPPTSLYEKLIKIGAKVTDHGYYLTFLLAALVASRQMLPDIPSLTARLRALPAPA
jgi:hypothetical protein